MSVQRPLMESEIKAAQDESVSAAEAPENLM